MAITTDFNEDRRRSSDKGSTGSTIPEHQGRDTWLRMNTKARLKSIRPALGNLQTRRHRDSPKCYGQQHFDFDLTCWRHKNKECFWPAWNLLLATDGIMLTAQYKEKAKVLKPCFIAIFFAHKKNFKIRKPTRATFKGNCNPYQVRMVNKEFTAFNVVTSQTWLNHIPEPWEDVQMDARLSRVVSEE